MDIEYISDDDEGTTTEETPQNVEWEIHNDLILASHPYNKLSLKFTDPQLETAYTTKRNVDLATRDAFGYFLAVTSMLTLSLAAKGNSVPVIWRWIVSQLPSCLLVSSRMRPLYYQHREALLVYTFLTTLCVHLRVQTYNSLAVPSFFFPFFPFLWLFLLISFFRIRFQFLLPLSLTCFIFDAPLLAKVCSGSENASLLSCTPTEFLKIASVVLGGPLLLAWFVEKKSREAFVLHRQSS